MPLSLYPLISEIVLTAAALGLLAVYHLRLYRQVQHHPLTTAVGVTNHARLMINVPPALEPSATVETVTAILNHGALHYTLGMRGFYLAIPMGLWLFGPLWMLGGAALLSAVLHRLDREV